MLEIIEKVFKWLTIISVIVTGGCFIMGIFFPVMGIIFTLKAFLVTIILQLVYKAIKKKLEN